MAKLLERIEHHLRRVQRIEAAEVVDAAVPPDFARHEATLLEVHEAYLDANPSGSARAAKRWARDLWSHQLEHVIDELHWELLAGFGGKLGAQARAELIDEGLCAAYVPGIERPVRPRSARLEVMTEAVVLSAASWSAGPMSPDHPWQITSRYCERLGLVSERPDPPRLRMSGHTYLRLRGLDRLRWLLALEHVHAIGDDDPWCISEAMVRWIAEHSDRVFDDGEDVPMWAQNESAVSRWAALGALHEWLEKDEEYEGHFTFGFRLTESGRQLFVPAVKDLSVLFDNLAHAQAQDDRSEVLRLIDGAEPTSRVAEKMLHARLVAHEVRNALLPVRYALRKVWRHLDGSELATSLAEPRRAIDEGLTRLYRYVETSARMSAAASEAAASFFILEAIEEARLELTELSGRVRVETNPGTANPRGCGHRGRFVLALLNLMRNAVQAGGGSVRISIIVDATDASETTISIIDDGPGVPESMRTSIFTNGVSSHANGSGHGLALVREVVEHELGGRVSFDPADGGGACFCLTLPSPEASQR
jgi:signal transduction histidine kinase